MAHTPVEHAWGWVAMGLSAVIAVAVFVAVTGNAIFGYACFAFGCAFYIVVYERLNHRGVQPAARRLSRTEQHQAWGLAAIAWGCSIVLLADPADADPWSPVALIPLAVSVGCYVAAAAIDVRTIAPVGRPVSLRQSEQVWRHAAPRIRNLTLMCVGIAAVWITSAMIATTRDPTCELGQTGACDAFGVALLVLFLVLPLVIVAALVMLIRTISDTSSRARQLPRKQR